eukprot:TRINITY_DN2998_c1_g1_i1.p1 TRINITY_DN2998_c1_g1~~TRINITY_DN2998_c1_g1_i1.p1  ORF type:complete len:376 (+),score=164.00 TRINITY_DN2998_c1_g1_i1:57-1130(+)
MSAMMKTQQPHQQIAVEKMGKEDAPEGKEDKESTVGGYGTDEVRSEGGSEGVKKEKEVVVPWMGEVEGVGLDEEIVCFAAFIGLNEQEKAARQQARSIVQQAASYFWVTSTVKVYGSHACNLSLPSSELDLIIESCGTYLTGYTAPFINYLAALGMKTLCVLEGTTDAFVKVSDSRSDLIINITLDTACSPVRYAAAKMKRVFTEQPAAGQVLLVLRTVLGQCSLMDVAKGGVSSYALTLMVFHALKKYNGKKVAPGTLLKDFLQLYGYDFDYKTSTINSDAPTKLHPADQVSIADLADPSANAADSVTKISQVRAMFKYLHLALDKWDHEEMADCRGKSPLSTIIAHKQLWGRAAK